MTRTLVLGIIAGLIAGFVLGLSWPSNTGGETPSLWVAVAPSQFTTFPASGSGQEHDPQQVRVTPPAPSRTPVPSVSVTTSGKRPAATMRPKPTAKPSAGRFLVSGVATWYAYHQGQAAAGWALRRALGLHWRESVVTVCGSTCIRVTLTDYESSTDHDKVIDLDSRDFAALAPLGRGIVKVRVSR